MHPHRNDLAAAERRRDVLAAADRPPVIGAPSRLRRRGPLVALAAVAAVVALPAAADAATADVSGSDLRIGDGRAENNAVNVAQLTDGRLRVTDPRGMGAGPGCVADGSFAVICSGANRVQVFGGEGDDSFLTFASVPTSFSGDQGNDTYVAGNAPGPLNVQFSGGAGRDRVNYAGVTTGVTVTKDNGASDGRTGRGDRDNILGDVEELMGSPFADSITGSSRADLPDTIIGLAGDDVLNGLGGRDVFLNEGASDGADRIFGGADTDHVSYTQRTRPVTVNLSDGGADDGEAGERDELREIESASGGSGDDTLKANPASLIGVTLAGGDGVDTITGTEQGDSLLGNRGQDQIDARGGADTVTIRDGEQDTASCGSGVDTFTADLGTDLMSGCENVRVGTVRISPRAAKTGTARIGRMTVAWRHPRSWRQLRDVRLRLIDNGAEVGEIVIAIRGRTVKADGAARVHSSRITRTGRTATARLALRLAPGLAGRKLRVEAEATDRRGRRQLKTQAATLRIAA